MKKTHIFLSAIMLLVLSNNTNGQTWGSGVVNTWTNDNVGIGSLLAPPNYSLGISTWVAESGAGNVGININQYWPTAISTGAVFPDNFQICYTPAGAFGVSPTTVTLDVFNAGGYLGILQPNPKAPLDVYGNALVENNLSVGSSYGIAYDANVSVLNWVAPSGAGIPGIKINRYWPAFISTGAVFPDNFQICYTPSGSSSAITLDAFNAGGWLGILQPNPLAPLDVNGDGIIEHNLHVQGGLIDMSEPAGTDTWRNINANSGITGLTVSAGTNGAATGGAYTTYHAAYESDPGATTIVSGDRGSGTTFWSYGGSSGPWNALMRIKPNGQVAIGMDIIYPTENLPNPDQYNLYVSKGILTQKLKVALPTDGTNWTDYVFNKDYDLMPLNRVESYVKANKHLPEVPSASEVAKDGIDVASMDAKLLQKIEELTLYVIQQQKQLETQKNEIELLKKKMD